MYWCHSGIWEMLLFGLKDVLFLHVSWLCYSIEELFEKFLQRLEEDYNFEEYTGNLVEEVGLIKFICD